MIELTAKNIRNAIFLGMLFGFGVTITNNVLSEIVWNLKYPNGWLDRAAKVEQP
jgi:hypothetical protein